MAEMNLTGRVALVTGASRGIGRGIAIGLAEAGADVAVNYTRGEEAAAETVAAIEADFGAMSILINNAGIASRGLSVAETTPEEVDKLFAVHAAGPHRLSRLALPQLRTHARSDIIIISSIATYTHSPNGAPYTMAKAAGEALALTLAKEEMRNGVRVNIVAPSLTVSDMGERLARAITGNDDIHHLDAQFPFGRVAVPADVAAAVAWFVSDANSYCSGQKLNIDGAGQATFR